MVDFPDELDTSFFARVRQNKQQSLSLLCIHVLFFFKLMSLRLFEPLITILFPLWSF